MNGSRRGLIASAILAGFFFAAAEGPANAENLQKTPAANSNFFSSAFYEVGTEYLFGFTQGSDIGQPGEKEIGWKSVGAFNKRTGNYKAWEHELEFSYTATENIYLALGILGVSTAITNVPGFDDRHVNSFSRPFRRTQMAHHQSRPGQAYRIDFVGRARMGAYR